MMAERSRWSESSEALRNGALNAEMLDVYYLLIDARDALEIEPILRLASILKNSSGLWHTRCLP